MNSICVEGREADGAIWATMSAQAGAHRRVQVEAAVQATAKLDLQHAVGSSRGFQPRRNAAPGMSVLMQTDLSLSLYISLS